MAKYTSDDGVISSKIPMGMKKKDEHTSMFGLYRGIVIRAVYPDDEDNRTGERMEYVVRVRGQNYPNCIDMTDTGAIYNHRTKIRKPSEKAFSGEANDGTYDENRDGEFVYVMFLKGHGDIPIIVGSDAHPRNAAYSLVQKSDGIIDEYELQGLEVKIDDDGSWSITQVGKKDLEGKITNKPAVGAQIKLNGPDGAITITNQKDGKQTVVIDDKGIAITDINKNSVVMDSKGILATDLTGNSVKMDDKGITIDVKGDAKITTSGKADIEVGGDAKINASGKCTIMGSEIDLNGSSGMVLTTVTDPVVDLITGAPTMGVATVKAG